VIYKNCLFLCGGEEDLVGDEISIEVIDLGIIIRICQ
jgi:hypothetical protein